MVLNQRPWGLGSNPEAIHHDYIMPKLAQPCGDSQRTMGTMSRAQGSPVLYLAVLEKPNGESGGTSRLWACKVCTTWVITPGQIFPLKDTAYIILKYHKSWGKNKKDKYKVLCGFTPI